MRFVSIPLVLLVWIGGLTCLSGCGGQTKLQKLGVGTLVPVQGKVTIAGKPLMGGNVFLYPPDGEAKFIPQGLIDSKGNYSINTSGEAGAPVGRYRVTVDPASDDNSQNLLVDNRYTSHAKSPLMVTVSEKAAPGAYDLKLEILK